MPKLTSAINSWTETEEQFGFDGMCGIRIIDPDDEKQRKLLAKLLENIEADEQ
ncbi:MAG: hypothetical protein QY316_12960 [Thermodesulfobacteriota bacterium]|nr:MAG: hypothetical protein QY316_12960 [Thermodesulfobacteriota bacterium]